MVSEEADIKSSFKNLLTLHNVHLELGETDLARKVMEVLVGKLD